MGWLFMRDLRGFASLQDYLDNQFTWEKDVRSSRVLLSRIVGRTYYAAVQHRASEEGTEETWAAVCLFSYRPRARDGEVFGYKDMSESMGPVQSACPASILDMLSPTDNEFALAWRARCRTRIQIEREIRARPTPKPGDILVFAEPLAFRNGASHTRFEVLSRRGRRPGLVLLGPDGRFYRIPALKRREYRIERP